MLHRRSILLLPSFGRRCFSKKYPLRTQTGSISSGQEKSREELDAMARQGKTVVPGGTGGKNLEAQENLAQGRSRGGNTRKKQLGTEGYQEIGSRGGEARKEQLGTGGYKELGRRGGQSKKKEHMDRKGERGDGVGKTERYGGEVVREKGDDSNFAWKGM